MCFDVVDSIEIVDGALELVECLVRQGKPYLDFLVEFQFLCQHRVKSQHNAISLQLHEVWWTIP